MTCCLHLPAARHRADTGSCLIDVAVKFTFSNAAKQDRPFYGQTPFPCLAIPPISLFYSYRFSKCRRTCRLSFHSLHSAQHTSSIGKTLHRLLTLRLAQWIFTTFLDVEYYSRRQLHSDLIRCKWGPLWLRTVAGHQSGASGELRSKPQQGKRTDSRSRCDQRSTSAKTDASGLGRHYAAA